MDSESLRTASTYLNNLLLARGLLRNSTPIDFVKPSKDSRAQIINLVHDLVLREDREKEQREQVAITIRTLRAEDTRKNIEIDRLTLKSTEGSKAAVAAQVAERQAKHDCKTLERQVKSLQDQTQKLKVQLAQVRTQCANDVRKRDLELQRLKTHLQGQQRGNRSAVVAPSISFTGARPQPNRLDLSVKETNDPAYSLKQESTEFLTQLSQSLSDENDGLISLIRHALSTTRELLGLSTQTGALQYPDSAIGSDNSSTYNDRAGRGSAGVRAIPTSYETLSADLEEVLSHLKGILTNPNFVPLSEVEEREEEILRLREGWDRMETRWRDVLLMMQGWQKRINTGQTIDLDELRLGLGLVSPRHRTSARRSTASDQYSTADGEDSDEIRPSTDLAGHSRPSSPSDGKGSESSISSKRKRTILEPPVDFDFRPSTQADATVAPKRKPARSPVRFRDEVEAFSDLNIPSGDESLDEHEPELSLQEKLDAAQTAAEAATRRQSSRFDNTVVSSNNDNNEERIGKSNGSMDELLGDTPGIPQGGSPMAKKTKIRGRPKRRSTLSRDELAALVLDGGGGGGGDDESF